MNILVSIDDTDDIDSRGTGEIADLLAAGIRAHGWGTCTQVTRHQLLLDPRIPYTSHNSSMCFTADVPEGELDSVIAYCCSELEAQSVPSSDPGLCIAVLERLTAPETMIAFGRKAKTSLLSKSEAYGVASVLGVHLSEHGGTGLGVIGALAGAGLRLSGNDGRFKGKLRIPSSQGMAKVIEIRQAGISLVKTMDGAVLPDSESVLVGDWVKPVLAGGQPVLLVVPGGEGGAPWRACERKVFQEY